MISLLLFCETNVDIWYDKGETFKIFPYYRHNNLKYMGR